MNPWKLYESLVEPIPENIIIEDAGVGKCWTYLISDAGSGFTIKPDYKSEIDGTKLKGLPLRQVANWVFEFDFQKSAFGLAAINSYWNSQSMILKNWGDKLNNKLDEGLVASTKSAIAQGKNIVSIGHFAFLNKIDSSGIKIIEKEPKGPMDYPDVACEYLIPGADLILVTASSLMNKTFPRLAELSKNSTLYLIGPSTPLYPGLKDYGVDRIYSACHVAEPDLLKEVVLTGAGGSIFNAAQLTVLETELV
jgi:uncharacterized protein (DUF4213/DUF364 family)